MDDTVETTADMSRALRASTSFVEKPNWWFLALSCLAIAILPWLAIFDFKYSVFLVYVLPWLIALFAISRAGNIQTARQKTAEQLLVDKFSLSAEEATDVWKQANKNPSIHGIIFLIVFPYIVIMTQWDIVSDRSYFSGGFWVVLGNVFLSIFFVVQAALFACIPIAAIRDDSKTIFLANTDTEDSLALLKPSERNDIEIITIEVDLNMSTKRVDAYTLESTLLSALAFSAFIAILYSDKYDFKTHLSGIDQCASATAESALKCINGLVLNPQDDNIKIYICLFLLCCSICFLSVLVARLRFNEAFRHIEELLKITQKINERENALENTNPEGAKSLTAEIEKMMGKLRTGSNYLKPMLRFIKLFRDAGIFFFILAIATCGWYFGKWAPLLILAVFTLASAYTFADRLWHQTGLLPLIGSTLPGLGRKRRR